MSNNTGQNETPVPLMAPLRGFSEQENEIIEAITNVVRSGGWVYGKEGKAFEEELREYIGCERTVAVASGTDALQLTLQALGVGPGDEVITPAYSFFASASVIMHLGAKPVFVDVHEKTFNINPDAVESAITEKTVGIIAVHLYGLPAENEKLREIADKNGIFYLEDACQAIGASINGIRVGGFGNFAAYSFYPTKNLGAIGEGGAVSGPDNPTMETISRLRLHGETKRYHHSLLGRNSRMHEIQAAALRIRLRKLDEWTRRRQDIASIYTSAWADLPLSVPYVPDGYEHVYHLYVLRIRDRERFSQHLSGKGIGFGFYYPVVLPLLEIFESLGHKPGEFPIAEKHTREAVAIPMFPQLSDEEIERVVSGVSSFFGI